MAERELEMAFKVPTDPVMEVYIGAAAGAAVPRVPHVSASGRLPFGLSVPAKRKCPSKQVTGPGKSQTEDADQVASEDHDEPVADVLPCPADDHQASGLVADPVLSSAAATEFDEALRLDKDEVDHNIAGDTDSLPAEHADSSVAMPSNSTTSRATGARFHSSLGIVGVSVLKRKGATCAHCNMSMDKGTVRLEFAQKLNKPGKSLHGGCVMQLPDSMVAQSMTFLEKAARTAASAVERSTCTDALQMLRNLHGPESGLA